MAKPRTRGIIVLQSDKTIDLLGYVNRIKQEFTYKINVFEAHFHQELLA